jgi:hypothetical protein
VDFTLAVVLLFVSSGGEAVAPSKARVEPPTKSEPAKPQPLPFSHKLHARLGLECFSCHPMPPPGWDMTYPAEEKCMQCHATIKTESPAIIKLAQYDKERKAVPWVQVYRVPDYVFFSHQTHYKKAEIGCEICHGPVAERDVITKEKPTTMMACMDCHKEKGAPVTCRICHDR